MVNNMCTPGRRKSQDQSFNLPCSSSVWDAKTQTNKQIKQTNKENPKSLHLLWGRMNMAHEKAMGRKDSFWLPMKTIPLLYF